MGKSMIVRYRTKAEAADENQRLVAGALAELAADGPGGLRYAAFRLADGVSFVHIVRYETEDAPCRGRRRSRRSRMGSLVAWTGPAVADEATLIGSYRFWHATAAATITNKRGKSHAAVHHRSRSAFATTRNRR